MVQRKDKIYRSRIVIDDIACGLSRCSVEVAYWTKLFD